MFLNHSYWDCIHNHLDRLMIKPTKWLCAQRRLRSESSLCAQWVAKDTSFLYADSEASAQTGRMPRLIWVFAGRTCHFVGFVLLLFYTLCRPWCLWSLTVWFLGGICNSIVSIPGHYFLIWFFNLLLFYLFMFAFGTPRPIPWVRPRGCMYV